MRVNGYLGYKGPSKDLYRQANQELVPKASKPWHKIVVDLVTVLVILGIFAWLLFGIA